MVPTETGKTVNDLLVAYFPDFMDLQFTARMEDQLDGVAEGEQEWQPVLHTFYDRFAVQLKDAKEKAPRMQPIEKVGRTCPTCGTGDLIIKYGRFGKFIGCSNYPECKHTEQLLEKTGHACPKCGMTDNGELILRKTKRGKTFYGCSRYPACDYTAWRLPNRRPSHPEPADAEHMPQRRKTAG
jgi:DNA topoisomerase-1